MQPSGRLGLCLPVSGETEAFDDYELVDTTDLVTFTLTNLLCDFVSLL